LRLISGKQGAQKKVATKKGKNVRDIGKEEILTESGSVTGRNLGHLAPSEKDGEVWGGFRARVKLSRRRTYRGTDIIFPISFAGKEKR